MNKLNAFNQKYVTSKQSMIPKVGTTVRVHQKIKEGSKTRIQQFEGIVISHKHGKEPGATFTVRKVIDSIGVEKIYPIYSPTIEKVETIRESKVRKSKLYYLRDKSSKETRKKLKSFSAGEIHAREELKEASNKKEDVEN